ncbi:hypothetical protein C8P66_1602 [Humitalea rosea]|uniref:Uncharacterized protein n=1 Tax=Humitalea rosea TaxID=990373 RepID=A0A2W7HTH0_9PROT|nr:hypothetical protein [Humitalea rosea]PZW36889.1 hypothetical protein C8P66_1602 [Humitalea rosea]
MILHDHPEFENLKSIFTPVDPDICLSLLIKAGFCQESYQKFNRVKVPSDADTRDLVIRFVLSGMPYNTYFHTSNDKSVVIAALDELRNSSVADREIIERICVIFLRNMCWTSAFDRSAIVSSDRQPAPHIDSLLDMSSHGALPYFVYGDSHSQIYAKFSILSNKHWLLPINGICHGGSARGLINEASHLRYGARFDRFYGKIKHHIKAGGRKLFLKFGQVDIEFVHAFHRAKSGSTRFSTEDFEAFCLNSVDKYFSFLTSRIDLSVRNSVYICSVCPPVLSDDTWKSGYIRVGWPMDHEVSEGNLEEEIQLIKALEMPTLQQRTAFHRHFNDLLKTRSESTGFNYLDDSQHFLSEDKIVDPKFTVRGKGLDCHIDPGLETENIMAPFIHQIVSTK